MSLLIPAREYPSIKTPDPGTGSGSRTRGKRARGGILAMKSKQESCQRPRRFALELINWFSNLHAVCRQDVRFVQRIQRKAIMV